MHYSQILSYMLRSVQLAQSLNNAKNPISLFWQTLLGNSKSTPPVPSSLYSKPYWLPFILDKWYYSENCICLIVKFWFVSKLVKVICYRFAPFYCSDGGRKQPKLNSDNWNQLEWEKIATVLIYWRWRNLVQVGQRDIEMVQLSWL